MLSFKQYLAEAISSNDKGVLHELLVGHELHKLVGRESDGEGHHLSADAKTKHDEIKSKISPEEYNDHLKMAQGTAQHLFNHFKGNIKSVHWTSKPGDIGRVTGTPESQQHNPSDIMIRHHDGSHTGISLKVTKKKYGKVPVGNPGAKQTDEQLGLSASRHYDEARKTLDSYPELQGKSTKERKDIIKNNPTLKSKVVAASNSAIGKIRDEWHDKLSSMSGEDLSNHLRNNLLHARQTKTPMYKVTTGGTGEDHSVEIEHPATHHDNILNDHQNITVHKAGNNSIEFKHNGKTFLRHRLKPESTPLVTALKGSAE